MPRLNTENRFRTGAYHVYNRGAGGRAIFRDREDRRYFLELLSRHISPQPRNDRRGRVYRHLRKRLLLLAFCLMATHFHLVVWQRSERALAELMELVLGGYSRHHNAKYGTNGPLFSGPYRAKRIGSAGYFRWLIGYVHDNHIDGLDYEFSSHRAWVDADECPVWLDPEPGLRIFGGLDGYREYLEQREQKRALDRSLGFGAAGR